MKYWAFISYSHRDEAWAAWLHRALETYRVPGALVGRQTPAGDVPSRLFPVFRDRDEFEASANLGARITEALGSSRSLIVICSPAAAGSQWVNQEIETFRLLGRQDRIFCLIVDGEPHAPEGCRERECFPPALSAALRAADGTAVERAEPLAADVRKGKDPRGDALLRLLAGALGLGYDDLKQREQTRRARRRRLLMSALAFMTVFTLTSYLGVCDAGIKVPVSGPVRDFIDRHELSLLRPVPSADQIDRVASGLRGELARKLLGQWRASNWRAKYMTHPAGPREGTDVWVAAQAVAAVLRCPGLGDDDFRTCLRILDEPFEPGLAIESKGTLYGWLPAHTDFTQAEPALWLATALALALGRPGGMTDAERVRMTEHLAYTQRAASSYIGDAGAWYMVSGTQRPENPSIYTTALAFTTLLETRAAGLPWEGNKDRCERLLQATAEWLIHEYDAADEHKGWHGTVNKEAIGVNDGLTIQLYSQLLRAGEEAGVALPAAMTDDIRSLIISLNTRGYNYPANIIRPMFTFRDYQGQLRDKIIAIRCLWHPWAVACAAQWLNSSLAKGALPEDRVRVRRALGHLVVGHMEDLQSDLISSAKKRTYVCAETLTGLTYVCLGGVPASGGAPGP